MKVLKISAKCSDLFWARLEEDNVEIANHSGYVISSMPEKHYGDYVELDIDIETGQILNWKKPSLTKLKSEMNGKG